MSKKEKLIEKLLSASKDISFDEIRALLSYFGYEMSNKGKTSGSRVKFVNRDRGTIILLHKPHPNNELKDYQRKLLLEHLIREGLL